MNSSSPNYKKRALDVDNYIVEKPNIKFVKAGNIFSGRICIDPTTGISFFLAIFIADKLFGYGEFTLIISGLNSLITFLT